ncbi:MAG: hypothetical protein RI953_1835 [Pseudomonadota bacterium]
MATHPRFFFSPWNLLISGAWALIFFLLAQSMLSDEFRERAISPVEFSLRSKIKGNPEISKRLKVVAYGDKAVREFGVQENLPLARWTQLIDAISSRSPRAIIFDKFFSFVLGNEQDVEAFKATLKKNETMVIAASAFGVLQNPDIQFKKEQFANWQIENPQNLHSGQMSTMLGPHSSISDAFPRIGDIQLLQTTTVQPGWIETSTGALLPHLTLSFAKNGSLSRYMVKVDNSEIPLDRHGRIPVDFIPRSAAYDNFIPAAPLLRLGRAAEQLQQINKDDVVLVLPAMFAGSADFKNSPVGRLEGGIYHMSVINSVLNNSPIIPVLSGKWSLLLVILSLAVLMLFACTKMKIKTGLAILFASTVSVVMCGLMGFVYFSFLADWHILSGFLIFNGSTLLAVRAIRDERQSQLIETALQGMVSPEVLQNIKNNPNILYKRPNELNLTVLFIDIEGFSLRTRESLSVDVFTILHAQLDMITQYVHSYGGVVDRILGDGLMCFFGFSFEDDGIQSMKPSEHSWRAVRCAIDIQREAARVTAHTHNPLASLGSVVPLRIGINTGDVFLGNLGSGKRLDFTIVGNTVNMAKRHEDACETFRILIGPETYKHIQSHPDFRHSDALDIRPRLLALKHHEDLVIGWECDPFSKNPELFSKATEKVKDAIGNSFSGKTSKPHQPVLVRVNKTDEGQLSEFHFERMTLVTKDYYCKKVYLSVEFRPQSKAMAKKLAEANLKSIYMQVLTGSPASEITYQHLVKVAHLTQDKLHQLHEILSYVDESTAE